MHEKMKRKRCVRREMIARHSQMNVREGWTDMGNEREMSWQETPDELIPRQTDKTVRRHHSKRDHTLPGNILISKPQQMPCTL